MSFWFKKPPRVLFIGNSTETANIPTLTNYKANDLIYGWAGNSTTATIPTVPAGVGYIAIDAGLAADNQGSIGAYRQCTTDGADGGLGTWTAAHTAYLGSFRYVDWKDPIGGFEHGSSASSASTTHGAVTLETKNSIVITQAQVSGGTAPGLRTDETLIFEKLNAALRSRWGRSTANPVATWGSQAVTHDASTAATAHHQSVEIRGRRR